MKITWYGHAAFLIEGQGLRIIMDPFSPESGYDPIDERADILLMSQDDDRFHSHVESVKGRPVTIVGRGLSDEGVTTKGVNFRAVQVWENTARDKNLNGMFHFTLDGVRLAHMGDIGHGLNEEEVAELEGIDVLLAITGNHHTIQIPDLMDAIGRIKPKIVVPMHYKTPKLRLDIHDNSEFMSYWRDDQVERVDKTSIEVTPESLPKETKVVLLEHAR